MIQSGPDQHTLRAAVADADWAETEFDDARAWLEMAMKGPMDPLAAEVWAFDEAFTHVLLVNHRWRGWVPPGGAVEHGETPREAAHRELLEETGITAELPYIPAAVAVRSYRSDWAPTLGLSYAAVIDSSLPLTGESHQPVAWIPLDHDWEGVFPEDRLRIREYARELGRTRAGTTRGATFLDVSLRR
ncbi:MAG: NUDIX domain-containing protein [Pseudonocardiaceae bacterium]